MQRTLICVAHCDGADGTEVARRIHARLPALPVIFMTGHGDTRGDSMLQKPFELDELLARIAELEQPS